MCCKPYLDSDKPVSRETWNHLRQTVIKYSDCAEVSDHNETNVF
jgi:hypothetical protein